MAQYKVLEKSFIGNSLVEAGAIVEYDGEPGPNLEAVGGKKGKGKAAPVEDAGADEPDANASGDAPELV